MIFPVGLLLIQPLWKHSNTFIFPPLLSSDFLYPSITAWGSGDGDSIYSLWSGLSFTLLSFAMWNLSFRLIPHNSKGAFSSTNAARGHEENEILSCNIANKSVWRSSSSWNAQCEAWESLQPLRLSKTKSEWRQPGKATLNKQMEKMYRYLLLR